MSVPARELAIFGSAPAFASPLHVGRPNIGDREQFLVRVNDMLDRRWFSNDGPFVQEFERQVEAYLGVPHCVAVCNATVGLAIAVRAMELTGEVILPSYTFVSTAHVLQWQNIKPIFVDMNPVTHNVCPDQVRAAINERTSAIIGVHVWGRGCDTERLESIAQSHGIPVLYDSAHAFGCSHQGRMIGNFGKCEVFSFHATKFLNSFEGGAITTHDTKLAEKLRLMRNFGFAGYDRVIELGTNGKMTEVCAAMGITSLEAIDDLIEVNRRNYHHYVTEFAALQGVSVLEYSSRERNNYHYIVIEVDAHRCPLNRDELVAVLHAENVLARKYFWPGCHGMQPYASDPPDARHSLVQTDRVAAQVIVLPNGQSVNTVDISRVSEILRIAIQRAPDVRARLQANLG